MTASDKIKKVIEVLESCTNRKDKRLKRDDLSWFNVEKYSIAKNWSLSDWGQNLLSRAQLRQRINYGATEYDELVVPSIVHLMLDPCPMRIENSSLSLMHDYDQPARIREKALFDMWTDIEVFNNPKMDDVRSNIEKLQMNMEDPTVDHDFLWLCLDDVSKERGMPDLPEKMLLIDLNATDAVLIFEFKRWLKNKRAKLGSNLPKTGFNTAEWDRYNVLGFIDIDIFARATGSTISNSTLGDLLFPDEIDVDLSERVRKVVRPMAEKIVDFDYITSLNYQAAIPE